MDAPHLPLRQTDCLEDQLEAHEHVHAYIQTCMHSYIYTLKLHTMHRLIVHEALGREPCDGLRFLGSVLGPLGSLVNPYIIPL